jgi:retron-type reverse transcriptase
VDKAKPFCISKWEVWEAYKRVKVNQGAAGVDGQSIAAFEEGLKDNLFKIWNRMSSAAISHHLYVGSIYQRTMGERGHWEFQRWQTALPRR